MVSDFHGHLKAMAMSIGCNPVTLHFELGQTVTLSKVKEDHLFILWLVLSDEQMSKRWPFSLLNDEQMSNRVGVKHLPVLFQGTL